MVHVECFVCDQWCQHSRFSGCNEIAGRVCRSPISTVIEQRERTPTVWKFVSRPIARRTRSCRGDRLVQSESPSKVHHDRRNARGTDHAWVQEDAHRVAIRVRFSGFVWMRSDSVSISTRTRARFKSCHRVGVRVPPMAEHEHDKSYWLDIQVFRKLTRGNFW